MSRRLGSESFFVALVLFAWSPPVDSFIVKSDRVKIKVFDLSRQLLPNINKSCYQRSFLCKRQSQSTTCLGMNLWGWFCMNTFPWFWWRCVRNTVIFVRMEKLEFVVHWWEKYWKVLCYTTANIKELWAFYCSIYCLPSVAFERFLACGGGYAWSFHIQSSICISATHRHKHDYGYHRYDLNATHRGGGYCWEFGSWCSDFFPQFVWFPAIMDLPRVCFVSLREDDFLDNAWIIIE